MISKTGAGPIPANTARIIHTAQALVDEVVTVDALPTRGGNTVAHSVNFEAGGSVNVLVAAARSGARCVQAGSVGTGRHGDLIRATLAAEGVQISSPVIAELDTGVCIVLLEPSGERTFVTTQGAERRISVDTLQTSHPRPGDYVCVSGYSLQGPTCDPLLAWLETLAEGVRVVLDPGSALAEVDERIIARILARTSVWTSNADEARALTGAAAIQESAPLVARRLRPDALVIVRDGPLGCVVTVSHHTTVVPGYPRKPVDTNGAGDAHTGVLVAELTAGMAPQKAARRANAAGAFKVTRHGPATAPTMAQIDAFLAAESAAVPGS